MVIEVYRLPYSMYSITTRPWWLGGFDDCAICHVFGHVLHESSVSLVDLLSALFAPFPILVPERAFIIFGLFLLFYSVAYLAVKRKTGLVTSGPYGIIRHPQYLGMILATLGLTSWSVWILNNTFGIGFLNSSQTIGVWLIELFAYVLLAHIEELFLSRNYGEVFKSYKNQVPFFIPLLKTNRQGLNILVSILILAFLLFGLLAVG